MTLQSVLLTSAAGLASLAGVAHLTAANTTSQAAPAKLTVVAAAPAAVAKATPTPSPTPTPVPVTMPVITPALRALPPLDLSDMRLWNYAGKWHASEWGNGMSPIPWKFDHVTQPAKTDTYFKLDSVGAPELQAMGGTPTYTRGLWESDVTAPQLRDGLVVAPLWIYDQNSGDEVDFEFAGRKGLDVTLHAAVNGAMQQNSVRLFAGSDMSNERHRYGIKVDETAGYVEMFVDGKSVQRWNRGALPMFVSHPLKPIFSMWAADPNNAGFVSWVGKWAGIKTTESLTMTVHGYGYTAIP